MKQLLISSLFTVLALFASCSDEDNKQPLKIDKVFNGSILLNGSPIAKDKACELNITENLASITLCGVQFAPTMPAMDITIPALDCKKEAEGYVISGKEVMPLVNGSPMGNFMIYSVEATLKDETFIVSAVTAMGTIGFSNAFKSPMEETPAETTYKGDLAVGDFVKEVTVGVTKNLTRGTVDFTIYDAKFAANMPLELDITLKDIPFTGSTGFAANNVAPYINNEPEAVPAYMFATIEGNVTGEELSFVARMSDEIAGYVAGKEFVFEGIKITE